MMHEHGGQVADHASHNGHDAHPGHDPHAGHHVHAGQDVHGSHAARAGHDPHAGHSVAMFRDRFWISLALTVPTLVWGHMLQSLLGYSAPTFPGSVWIPPVFGTAVFVYGGRPFIQGAVRELRDRLPGMMTLIALAISVAFVFSVVVTAGYPGMPLWEELSTLVTIMLLGHWIEMRSVTQAQGALRELAKLLPNEATRITGDATQTVAIDQLHVGDLVLVRPGERIPADGVVRQGASTVDESMITGESRPIEKESGRTVIAGTVNGAGALRVEVTGTGEQTALAGIMRLVADAQSSRSRAQDLADRAAFALTIIAITAGVVTLVTWLILRPGDPGFAIERLVSVLVIACPHALGLAIPLVIAISTTLGARNGLLVRNRRGLEDARTLTTIVFDKTGTLTRGEFGIIDIAVTDGLSADDALRLTASVEAASEHTIAQGIVRSAQARHLAMAPADHFEAIPGMGAHGRVEGRDLYVGGPALVRDRKLDLPPAMQQAIDRATARAATPVVLADDRAVLATFALADVVRPESREAVRTLRDRGIDVVMMTGDARPVATAVARDVGIDTVFADVLPAEKASKVQMLEQSGQRVGMVGDGVNDAPALLTANVGIAIGAGTDVAVEAGDIVLVRDDPRDVPRILTLSQATYRKMVQNLVWATAYNVVAIPLAAGVLEPWGIVLSPAIGAAVMSLSTVIVAVNAQLLRRVTL
jgi:Cu2+-exporting ATPase